jgi:prevent-host-death family protein
MKTISAFAAKTRFGELLERVMRGEEVVITRHDRPVARMIPEGRPSLIEARRAVAELAALRKRILKRTRGRAALSDREVRAAIEHGRR